MEKILRRVYENKGLTLALKIFSYIASAFSVAVFCVLLIFYYKISLTTAVAYLASLGLPFVLVSLIRLLIDAKRPYQLYDFYDSKPKSKNGSSFPSRHAFSAFAIGTLALFSHTALGIILLILGALMCACRVLCGMHFIRDVVCGAIIGAASSVIGALILL